jgi:transposase
MASGRRWTAEQKRAIVEEYESTPWGAKGGVLRRHNIPHKRLALWVSYRDAGILDTGRRSNGWQARMTPPGESAEIGRLRAQVRRLERELEKSHRDRVVAEAAAEALGKASALLQSLLQSADSTEGPESEPGSSTASSPDASGSSGPPG